MQLDRLTLIHVSDSRIVPLVDSWSVDTRQRTKLAFVRFWLTLAGNKPLPLQARFDCRLAVASSVQPDECSALEW